MENTTKPLPPWADKIPEGAFISYETTYKVGEYFYLFKKIKSGYSLPFSRPCSVGS